MKRWKHGVKVKHLFTDEEDHESIQKSMNDIADVLDKSTPFISFNTKRFRLIPKCDDFIGALEYANTLIEKMYGYADDNGIWID